MNPKQVLEKWLDVFNKANAETISNLYAENAITTRWPMNLLLVGQQ
jgi:ketosteroid isomerase-like protein